MMANSSGNTCILIPFELINHSERYWDQSSDADIDAYMKRISDAIIFYKDIIKNEKFDSPCNQQVSKLTLEVILFRLEILMLYLKKEFHTIIEILKKNPNKLDSLFNPLFFHCNYHHYQSTYNFLTNRLHLILLEKIDPEKLLSSVASSCDANGILMFTKCISKRFNKQKEKSKNLKLEIEKLKNSIKELKDENEHLRYSPDGYLAAKEHFELFCKRQPENIKNN